ncbi:MAG: nucleotidyl transferase AbiEii/AbiGii toxin family protein [Geobacter sp.]|nr:nucleotidyl transferase AbiEii/AbiGii toxin family protein [Geobacter sp.]
MFFNAVDKQLLLLIDQLAVCPEVAESFYLAGGTGLALQLGHRTSIDIDLFSQQAFNAERYASLLIRLGGRVIQSEEGSVHGVAADIKVSFLYYPYPMLKPFQVVRGLKVASIDDIAAMKVVAISQRGDKKDFFDLYEILKNVSPRDVKTLFLKKFGASRINCYHILKSLLYFDDAEQQPDPLSLNGTTWEQVKGYFLEHEKELMQELIC